MSFQRLSTFSKVVKQEIGLNEDAAPQNEATSSPQKAKSTKIHSYMLIPLCIIQKEDGQALSNVRTQQVIESARKKVFGYPTQHRKERHGR